MDTYEAISIIQDHLDNIWGPEKNWPRYFFRRKSAEKWVCQEIVKDLKKNDTQDPKITIENFINKLDGFSEIGDKECQLSFIFAREASKDVLNLLYGAEPIRHVYAI